MNYTAFKTFPIRITVKSLLILSCCLLSSISWTKEKMTYYSYEITSDVFDASIPKGKYVLEGRVFKLNGEQKVGLNSVVLGDSKYVLIKSGKKGYFSKQVAIGTQFVFYSCSSSDRDSYFESYTIQDQHRITIEVQTYVSDKQEIRDEKPVVYCYTDHELDVVINLKTHGKMLFSYPQLSDSSSWNVHLKPSEMMQMTSGQQVPYLFWESTQFSDIAWQQTNDQFSGKLITGNESLTYLETTLETLGFNAQEKTDFITYWGPRMSSKNYVFIQFFINESCEQFAHYEVSPKPDVFNRVFMVFTSYEQFPENLKPTKQDFSPLERSGFHLLEWGGIEYQSDFLIGMN